MKRDPQAWIAVAVIYTLYFVSFVLPVYEWNGPRLGWQVFLECAQALVEPNNSAAFVRDCCTWAPNPLLWFGVMFLWLDRPHFAVMLGIAAVALSGRTLYEGEYFTFNNVNVNEWRTLGNRSGAYVWFASMIALTLSGIIFTVRKWRRYRYLPMIGEQ